MGAWAGGWLGGWVDGWVGWSVGRSAGRIGLSITRRTARRRAQRREERLCKQQEKEEPGYRLGFPVNATAWGATLSNSCAVSFFPGVAEGGAAGGGAGGGGGAVKQEVQGGGGENAGDGEAGAEANAGKLPRSEVLVFCSARLLDSCHGLALPAQGTSGLTTIRRTDRCPDPWA